MNCGTTVAGRFCQNCGQENTEPQEGFFTIVSHFFNDITHFDGKFFQTVRLMISKPGFLPAEYVRGRRASYLNPIRMYIFTSAVFFILFFSIAEINLSRSAGGGRVIDQTVANMKADAKTAEDSAQVLKLVDSLQQAFGTIDTIQAGNSIIQIAPDRLRTIEKYEEEQAKLPPAERDGWLKSKYKRKMIQANAEMVKDGTGYLKRLLSSFLHQFPKLFFVSLPLFALIMQLMYRKRKDILYVSHGIFSIYQYIFSFLVMMVLFLLNWLNSVGMPGARLLATAGILGFFYYSYKAMRYFYGDSRGRTIVKLLGVSFLGFWMILCLFVIFLGLSFFQT